MSLEDQETRFRERGVLSESSDSVDVRILFSRGDHEIIGYDGQEVDPQDAKNAPQCIIEADPSKYYCIICYDPDAPMSGAAFLSDIPHWVVWNCKGNVDTSEGDTIVHWRGPKPPVGAHRYIFLVCEQLSGYVDKLPDSPPRMCASICRYIVNNNIEIAAMTHFVSRAGGIKSPNDLPALTGARGLVALMIMVFHFYQFYSKGQPTHTFTRNIAYRSYMGVGFFFVLSGFIMVWVYASRGVVAQNFKSYGIFRKQYWAARFARIVPMYVVSCLLILPFSLSVWDNITDVWPRPQNGALCMSLTSVGLQAWIPGRAVECLNPLLWSVSAELFFYFCFPFLLLLCYRWCKGGSISIAIAAVTLGIISELALWGGMYRLAELSDTNFPTDYTAKQLPYGFPIVRLPEFLMGMAMGALYLGVAQMDISKQKKLIGGLITDGITVAIIMVMGYMSSSTYDISFMYNNDNGSRKDMSFGVWYWVILTMIPFWVLGLAFGAGISCWVLSTRLFVYLGKVSYCIYVLQYQVLTYAAWMSNSDKGATYIFKTWAVDDQGTLPEWSLPFLIVVCIILSGLSHNYIESPARQSIVLWAKPEEDAEVNNRRSAA
eukprot:TRINITY_DN20340_c0_g1_i1.p1 TRINITY_DN20340_c0_g1~~TRINITY_DN20340_c0_g1_i1.p1  ORF type:complete len:602 (+),score=90.93 TRINITY_DN20340_c0_g1_i1:40-1845(+)